MAKGSEVLAMLLPAGGWTMVDNAYDSIIYDEGVSPITEAEFIAGFDKYNAWKAAQDAKEATALATATAKLTALGLTAADLKALGL